MSRPVRSGPDHGVCEPTSEAASPFDDRLALLEASRCLLCGSPTEQAPCSAACPAELDVPGFIAAIVRGSWEEAAQAIFGENLLAASCATTCAAEQLCAGACVLAREGKLPIDIARLERYVTDLAFENPWTTFRCSAPPTGRHVTVIGAGPAGLACAGELAVLGHAVTVLEAASEFGGLLRARAAADLQERAHLLNEVRLIIALGVELYLDSPVRTPERLWQIEFASDAIFLGIGTQGSKPGPGKSWGGDDPEQVVDRDPRQQFLLWVEGLDLEQGRPRVDPETGQTTNPKYFAGGAVVDGGGGIGSAVRAGKHAARGIDRWLRQRDRDAASWPTGPVWPPPLPSPEAPIE